MGRGLLMPYTNAEKKALHCITEGSTTLHVSLDESKFLAILASTLSRNTSFTKNAMLSLI